jgi:hypothetical protein
MSEQRAFRRHDIPRIYAYSEDTHRNTPWDDGQGVGLLKIGYTTRSVEERIAEQFGVARPGAQPWHLELSEEATTDHGHSFTDKDVHRLLRGLGRQQIRNDAGQLTEYFACTVDDVHAAINQLRTGQTASSTGRNATFAMRPEQQQAVEQAADHFATYSKKKMGQAPKYLWNAKMRFGKTFATYQLARKMGWTRILVLTYKPAVEDAWRTDLAEHHDFDGWQFISRAGVHDGNTWHEKAGFEKIDETRPIVWFASFQDVRGRNGNAPKERHEEIYLADWDCVVLDEYHFGAWNEASRDLYDEEKDEVSPAEEFDEKDFEDAVKLSVNHYLYLSGTPFRSLANGEFQDDQVYTWTYDREQDAKSRWDSEQGANPYAELPTMTLVTYRLPQEVREVVAEGDLDEFDLNAFFHATKTTEDGHTRYRFTHEESVQKWLDLLRGQYKPWDPHNASGALPPVPYADAALRANLQHSLWLLPSIAACEAMGQLLAQPQNAFYSDYKIIVAAGTKAGTGLAALEPVKRAMTGNPLKTRTITLSCGKLTTGVTVPAWTGIFMLKNLSSPESYFQAAFRVQSPWTVRSVDPEAGQVKHIIKHQCYVFDFDPNRALKLVTSYATQLDTGPKTSMERQVEQFVRFLPVLAFDGSRMIPLDARELLDFAVTGTAATLLARQWQSARLVNITTASLERLLSHPDLLERLEEIEAFRNLRENISKTITSERELKKTKRERGKDLSKKEKKEISEEDKKNRTFRQELRDNLLKFAVRLPIFMYLTDAREEKLVDLIQEVEPGLFRRVTNLTKEDFALLCELGVFNETTMNDAVFAFRRFEMASLEYAGNAPENIHYGGWDSYATREDLETGAV